MKLDFKDRVFRCDLNEIARLVDTRTGWSVLLVEWDDWLWWVHDEKVAHPRSIGRLFRQPHKALVWGMTVWDAHEPHVEVESNSKSSWVTGPCKIGVVDPDGKARTLRLAKINTFSVRFLDADTGEPPEWLTTHLDVVRALNEVFKTVGSKGVIAIDDPLKKVKAAPNWGRPYYEIWGYAPAGRVGPYIVNKYERWCHFMTEYDDLGEAIIAVVNSLADKGCASFKIRRYDDW
jgi:hypothetical protein